MVSIEKFIVDSKLTGHTNTFRYDANGNALIKVKLKYKNYTFDKVILAKDYIKDVKMPHAYQIKENIFKKDFENFKLKKGGMINNELNYTIGGL